jgi:peptide chain release factor 3
MQSYFIEGAQARVPLLGAVGPLQFDVVRFRLESEYGADSRLETAPWTTMRWIESGEVAEADLPASSRLALDANGQRVILFVSEWACDYFQRKNAAVRLSTIPAAGQATPSQT